MDWVYLNGFLLFFPLFFIRYILLSLLSQDALNRAYFAPPVKERLMMIVYQVSQLLLFLSLFFYKIKFTHLINKIGFGILILGFIIYLISTINYAHPHEGINMNGLYKLSRNPMYVGFFIYFLGVSMILESIILFILLVIFQFASHYIIKSEEEWCMNNFGEKYKHYMKKVRRYF